MNWEISIDLHGHQLFFFFSKYINCLKPKSEGNWYTFKGQTKQLLAKDSVKKTMRDTLSNFFKTVNINFITMIIIDLEFAASGYF